MFSYNPKVLFKLGDPAGIVFYPRYLEIIDDCVEAFFVRMGHPLKHILNTSAIPPVEISTRFTAARRHRDHLNLSLDVEKVGDTSLALTFRTNAGEEQRFVSNSPIVHVSKDGRAAFRPDEIKVALTKHLWSSQ